MSFVCVGLDDDKSEREDSESGSQSEFEEDAPPGQEILEPPVETKYVENKNEELGQVTSVDLGKYNLKLANEKIF